MFSRCWCGDAHASTQFKYIVHFETHTAAKSTDVGAAGYVAASSAKMALGVDMFVLVYGQESRASLKMYVETVKASASMMQPSQSEHEYMNWL